MRKIAFILFLGALSGTHSLKAQPQKQYTVKPLENANKVIPARERYQFSIFLDGIIYFKNGRATRKMPMNYNMLAKDVDYISPTGDTLIFVIDTPVDFVKIGDEEFFYDDVLGFLDVIRNGDRVKLASQQQWNIVRKEKLAADGYGYASQTVGTNSIRSIPGTNYQYTMDENTIFGKKEILFLIDSGNHVYHATRSGFVDCFPRLKQEIKSYVRSEKLTFYQGRKDIEKLYLHCIELSRDQLK